MEAWRRSDPGPLLGVLRPVQQVARAKDEADAIRIANDSPVGLGLTEFVNHKLIGVDGGSSMDRPSHAARSSNAQPQRRSLCTTNKSYPS